MERNTDIITADIVDVAYRIHRDLGPGLVEKIYARVAAAALRRRGYTIEEQVRITFEFEGIRFEGGLVIDLLVNDCVVVEVKAAEKTLPLYKRQTFTYLRLSGRNVALLLNFGAATMKEGTHRIVHNYTPTAESKLRINK